MTPSPAFVLLLAVVALPAAGATVTITNPVGSTATYSYGSIVDAPWSFTSSSSALPCGLTAGTVDVCGVKLTGNGTLTIAAQGANTGPFSGQLAVTFDLATAASGPLPLSLELQIDTKADYVFTATGSVTPNAAQTAIDLPLTAWDQVFAVAMASGAVYGSTGSLPMTPATFLGGWNGTGSATVVVPFQNAMAGDVITFSITQNSLDIGVAPVPEPATWGLAALGLAAGCGRRGVGYWRRGGRGAGGGIQR